MNLLCPNCQKMLTVPEQYAGQLMKCPLCNGTFTVPTLPAPPPAPPPSSAPPPAGPDIYGFKEPLPPPPTTAPPAPDLTTPAPGPSLPPPPPPPPGEYARISSIFFSPKVIQLIPAVAVVLLFFLQFAPWVGVYFGSYSVVTQNAWGAMYGSRPAEENDLKSLFHWTTAKELEKKEPENYPKMSLLTLFYLLLFYPTAALTLACVVAGFVPLHLPPAVQGLLKWRWALALLLNLLLFFFLVLQLAVGFGMEEGIRSAEAAKQASRVKEQSDKDAPIPKMQTDAEISQAASRVQHTYWLDLVVVLHLLIIFSAGMMFWLNQREPFNKPMPRLDFRW